MTQGTKIALGVTITALTVVAFATVPILRTSPPGKIARFCFGEPEATQWVNDTADKIASAGWTTELNEMSDRLISEFGPISATLQSEPFSHGRLIPLNELPIKYRDLHRGDPDLVLQTDEHESPVAMLISWGHTREAIMVFARPPSKPPGGFSVRRVTERIYVIANLS